MTPRFSGQAPPPLGPSSQLATGLSPLASCPAQRAGAQRLCALEGEQTCRRRGQNDAIDPKLSFHLLGALAVLGRIRSVGESGVATRLGRMAYDSKSSSACSFPR